MSSKADGKKIIGIHLGEKKVIIKFIDGKLDVTHNTYLEKRLFEGKILSNDDIKELEYLNSLDKYLEFAKKSVLTSQCSEKTLKDKLVKKGANKKTIDYIINELKKYDLINDDTFLKDLLDSYEYRLYGKNRIVENLIKKGLEKDKINNLKFNDNKEYQKGLKLLPNLEKRFAKYNYQMKKSHIHQALLRYGYDIDIANKIIVNIKENDIKHELETLKNDYQKIKTKYVKKYDSFELDDHITKYLLAKGYQYKDILKIKGDK